MSEDWPRLTVAMLQEQGLLLVEDGNHGEYRPRADEFCFSGTAFIRASDMDGGRILFNSASKINETALARIRKGVGRAGDILFSHKGTVGKLALVPDVCPPFVCSPQTTFWRSLDDSHLDRRYLYCYMQSIEFRNQWSSRKGETDMADYVSLTAQRELRVAVPPIQEQRAIAECLSALDDKVELNRQTIETLEVMARSLFKSWFDQQPGNGISIGELEADGLLAVNDGYRAKNSELGAPGLPFVRAGNLNGGGFDLAGSDHLAESRIGLAGVKLSQPGDVAFTSKGTVGRFAFVHKTTPKFVYSPQLCFWRSMKPDQLDPHVLFQWMKSDELADQLDAVKGQTDMADYVSLRDQRRMKFTAQLGAVQVELGRRLEPLMDRVAANLQQSRTLVTLRDSLLPKLLSGEIRLRNAERKIKEVV